MSMEEDNARDYRAKNAMDELRRSIEEFLASDEGRRAGRVTRETLELAAAALQRDADHVVAVWN